MKLFACILSFYILVLTAVPCIDVLQDNTLQKVELSDSTTGHHHNNTDHCSPFCACNCCVSPILYQDYVNQFNGFSFSQKCLSAYTSAYIYSPYTVIWQPPKIS